MPTTYQMVEKNTETERETETRKREWLIKCSKMLTFESQGEKYVRILCTHLCKFSVNLKLFIISE